ncbi:MAG: glucan biosynthesis protein, partial [Pseudomonadota bacterium]
MNSTRRTLLGFLMASAALPALGQTTAPGQPFSHTWLKAEMQARAEAPYQPPALLEGFLQNLDYDDYRLIRFRRSHARWSETPLNFHVLAFHPGWLYKEPVMIHEVENGAARPMAFTTEDFEYLNELAARVPTEATLPGIAGLKINNPLNRADVFDELITFVGASYFRALGRENSYGLSARGIAINTWLDGPEEFPRFSEFWLERPAEGGTHLILHAALEGPSLTGAYRFTITPGADTTVEVEATLFFRESVEQLGLAPLTSMFYFAEHSERRFNDYRPQVHDSDALKIIRRDGDILFRPLGNPPRVS